MTTKTVGGTVINLAGTAVPNAQITIHLVTKTAFRTGDSASVVPDFTIFSNSSGIWTAVVECNDTITPAGTIYEVKETYDFGGWKTYLIQVLSTLPGGTNQVLSLIVPEMSPVGVVNNFLTKDQGDASYAPIDSAFIPGPPGPTGPTGPTGPAGQGVPVGGTTSQVLSKRTAANYDTQWTDAGVDLATADARYINVAGDTMTGQLSVLTTPSAAANATSKSYVDSQDIVIQQQERSKGGGLVTNGSAVLLSNYNFSSLTYVGGDRPAGTSGSFLCPAGLGVTHFTDEFIPVDVNKYYLLGIWVRETSGTSIAPNTYTGFAPFDVDGLSIQGQYVMYQANTLTTLAVDLNPGATTITLTSAANWNNSAAALTYLRSMIPWNYIDGTGYAWPAQTYSRNWYPDLWADGGISGNVITLKVPWAGPAIPAGTQVSNGSSGSAYMYSCWAGTATPLTWTFRDNKTAIVGGGVHSGGTVPTVKFPYGTAKIKMVFLGNRVTNSRIAYAGISLSESITPPIPAGGTTNQVLTKKSATDYDTQWAPLPLINRWRSTYWYGQGISSLTTATPGEGILLVNGLLIPDGLALTEIGCEVTTVGTAGAVVRLGVYELSTTGVNSVLVQDAGTIDGTVLGAASLPLSIAARTTSWYALLCAVVQGAASTRPLLRYANAVQEAPFGRATLSTAMTVIGINGFLASGISGVLPATATTIAEASGAPRIMVRGTQS